MNTRFGTAVPAGPSGGRRVRVLIVDDSAVMRRMVSLALESDPSVEVVGIAGNGELALAQIPRLNPDVVTMDIEMPEMDGLATLRHIRAKYPDLRVIMLSSLTTSGAAVTLRALALGADDYVAKVSNELTLDGALARLRSELVPKILQFFQRPEASLGSSVPRTGSSPVARPEPRVVAIGASTGGPVALGHVLSKFPASFPLPIMVVQHMPPMFTRLLAEQLQSACELRVAEARDGEPIQAGKILIAPGDYHMTAAPDGRGFRVRLDQSPAVNYCRPAVDVLFTSLTQTHGGAVTAAILTGMGQDGLRGVEALRAMGASIVAQDEATSVVWGMPGAVTRAGLADAVVPLDKVAPEILRRCAPATRL